MFETPPSLLVALLLTHVIADFILPFKRVMATPTFRTRWLGLAALACVHGVAVFLVLHLGRPSAGGSAWAGVLVAVTWLVGSQAIPRLSVQPITRLLLEHLAHIAVLLGVWLTTEHYWGEVGGFLTQQLTSRNLVLILAYLLVLRPASALIGAALTPWLSAVSTQDSLKNAGAPIGYLERTLILTFVLLQQWEAVGFLLTAKSILRFTEIQKPEARQISEYVLLGTLMSFTLSIGIGLLARNLM
jgi:hypothetical protein